MRDRYRIADVYHSGSPGVIRLSGIHWWSDDLLTPVSIPHMWFATRVQIHDPLAMLLVGACVEIGPTVTTDVQPLPHDFIIMDLYTEVNGAPFSLITSGRIPIDAEPTTILQRQDKTVDAFLPASGSLVPGHPINSQRTQDMVALFDPPIVPTIGSIYWVVTHLASDTPLPLVVVPGFGGGFGQEQLGDGTLINYTSQDGYPSGLDGLTYDTMVARIDSGIPYALYVGIVYQVPSGHTYAQVVG